MNWISKRRRTLAIAVVLIAGVAIAAGVVLEWQLATKVYLKIDQNGTEVQSFTYRRESDDLEPCRTDMHRLIQSFEGNDFTFDMDLTVSSNKIALALVSMYRVQYASGSLTIWEKSMDGTLTVLFSDSVNSETKLKKTLPDRLVKLVGQFRDDARLQLQRQEAAVESAGGRGGA